MVLYHREIDTNTAPVDCLVKSALAMSLALVWVCLLMLFGWLVARVSIDRALTSAVPMPMPTPLPRPLRSSCLPSLPDVGVGR